jgi:hypothetical protein
LGRQPADPEHPYGTIAQRISARWGAAVLLAGGLIVAARGRPPLNPGGTPDTDWYVFVVIVTALAVVPDQ